MAETDGVLNWGRGEVFELLTYNNTNGMVETDNLLERSNQLWSGWGGKLVV